jgi:hypothetical protein
MGKKLVRNYPTIDLIKAVVLFGIRREKLREWLQANALKTKSIVHLRSYDNC